MIDPSADVTLLLGDVVAALKQIPSGCVDSVVTDPPYNIKIKGGNAWDSYRTDAFIDFCESWARECLRVLKPGGWIFAFGSPKTRHQIALGIERAGFEPMDAIAWIYAASMQKSFGMTPEKLAKVEDPVLREQLTGRSFALANKHDPIFVGRKRSKLPLLTTYSEYGTGTLDITSTRSADGSWPPNVVFSHHPDCVEDGACIEGCPVKELGPPAAGFPSFYWHDKASSHEKVSVEVGVGEGTQKLFHIDKRRWKCRVCGLVTGSYLGSANQSIPHKICDCNDLEPLHRNDFSHTITHPDPKPVGLARWLVRLATLPGQLVVDCFAGSGALAEAAVIEGRRFIGIDNHAPYLELQRVRLRRQHCVRVREMAEVGDGVAMR